MSYSCLFLFILDYCTMFCNLDVLNVQPSDWLHTLLTRARKMLIGPASHSALVMSQVRPRVRWRARKFREKIRGSADVHGDFREKYCAITIACRKNL